MVPGQALAVACFIGDGSSQHIGSVLFAFLVHIDGDHAVLAAHDLDDIFADIHGPYNFKLDGTHGDGAHALKILGGQFCHVLVHGLDVSDGGFDRLAVIVLNGRLADFRGRSRGGVGLLRLLAACEQGETKSKHQEDRNNFFHH